MVTRQQQETLVVVKSVKWMINLGIPILVIMMGFALRTLETMQATDVQNAKDIAVLQERVSGLEHYMGHTVNGKQTSSVDEVYNKTFLIEAILPKPHDLLSLVTPPKYH